MLNLTVLIFALLCFEVSRMIQGFIFPMSTGAGIPCHTDLLQTLALTDVLIEHLAGLLSVVI